MRLAIDMTKCMGCMACEMACGYHRDDGFAFLSSSIQVYRSKEKKDYSGIMLKEDEYLVLSRPEGLEVSRIGAIEEDPEKEADASAKPLLLREGCDFCEAMDGGPMCIKFCPVDAITLGE